MRCKHDSHDNKCIKCAREFYQSYPKLSPTKEEYGTKFTKAVFKDKIKSDSEHIKRLKKRLAQKKEEHNKKEQMKKGALA